VSTGEIIAAVVAGAVFLLQLVTAQAQPKQPSRFRRALWAQSVRKRGLTEDAALREAYILGYVKTPPREPGVEWKVSR